MVERRRRRIASPFIQFIINQSGVRIVVDVCVIGNQQASILLGTDGVIGELVFSISTRAVTIGRWGYVQFLQEYLLFWLVGVSRFGHVNFGVQALRGCCNRHNTVRLV